MENCVPKNMMSAYKYSWMKTCKHGKHALRISLCQNNTCHLKQWLIKQMWVVQNNLVCDNLWRKQLVWSAFTVGVGIGSVMFSAISDRFALCTCLLGLYCWYIQIWTSKNILWMFGISYNCRIISMHFIELLDIFDISTIARHGRKWLLVVDLHYL